MCMGTHTCAQRHVYFISTCIPALFKTTLSYTIFFPTILLLFLVCFNLTFHLLLFDSHFMKGEFLRQKL